MAGRSAFIAPLLLCTLVSACATAPPQSKEYITYSEQLELNEGRYETCTLGHTKQYLASGTFSNEKIVRAALKQCRVYVDNYCHAWLERDTLESDPADATFEWKVSGKEACTADFTETRRTLLTGYLAKHSK